MFEVFSIPFLVNLCLQTLLQKPFSDTALAKYDKQPPKQNILYYLCKSSYIFYGIKLTKFSIKSFSCCLFHCNRTLNFRFYKMGETRVCNSFMLIEDWLNMHIWLPCLQTLIKIIFKKTRIRQSWDYNHHLLKWFWSYISLKKLSEKKPTKENLCLYII